MIKTFCYIFRTQKLQVLSTKVNVPKNKFLTIILRAQHINMGILYIKINSKFLKSFHLNTKLNHF